MTLIFSYEKMSRTRVRTRTKNNSHLRHHCACCALNWMTITRMTLKRFSMKRLVCGINTVTREMTWSRSITRTRFNCCCDMNTLTRKMTMKMTRTRKSVQWIKTNKRQMWTNMNRGRIAQRHNNNYWTNVTAGLAKPQQHLLYK